MKPINFRLLLITFLILFLTGLSSCSDKNDTPDVPDIPEKPNQPTTPTEPSDEEFYDNYVSEVNDLCDRISSGEIADYSDLKEFAKSNKEIVSVDDSKGMAVVKFKGNWDFFWDPEGNSMPSSNNWEVNQEELNALQKELDEFLSFANEEKSHSRGSANPLYIPRTYKVLFWCPLEDEWAVPEKENIRKICNNIKIGEKTVIDLSVKIGDDCSVWDFSEFSSYDLVYFATHGTNDGSPTVPINFKGLASTEKQRLLMSGDVLFYTLDYKFLESHLAKMSNTILWTCMCYSHTYNSVLANAAKDKNAGDYYGATDPIQSGTVLSFFMPFIYRLYVGANSKNAFSPEGHSGIKYPSKDGVTGVFGHNNVSFPGICFPHHYPREAENNLPIACFQAPTGVMDKVISGNGPFKGGIELHNDNNGKTVTIELSSENISSSESKTFKNIVEAYKYAFKTDELEPGDYKYRTYITYPDGATKYSDNYETITIMDQDTKYFELYLDINEGSRIGSMQFTGNINILGVLCDNNSINYDYLGYDYLDFDNLLLFFDDSPVGIHRCRIFYEGDIESINESYYTTLCGGYFPYSIEDIYIANQKIKHISSDSNNRGDYTLTVPNSIKNIDMRECQFLTTVDLSNCSNLTTIQSTFRDWTLGEFRANFLGCNSLSSIDLSDCSRLTTIEDYAFESSALSSINLSDCSSLTTIGKYAFRKCSSLSSIDLSNCTNLTTIGMEAFSGCSSLSSIDLSDCSSLTTIGVGAFLECSSLSSIDLSKCSNLTEIEAAAFRYCNLSQITIPACVKEIEFNSFNDNPLKNAYCYPNNPPGYSNPFDEGCKIYVPAQSLEAYQKAWGEWEYINGIRTCVNIFPM